MPRYRLVTAIVFLVSLAPLTGSFAQQARIQLSVRDAITNIESIDCSFSHPAGLGTATVTVVNAFPFQTIRFKAPAPCGFVVYQTTSPFPFTGNPETGVEITLGSCTIAPVDVLTLSFTAPAAVSDCSWDVAPADGDADILLTDCDGFTMKGASALGMYCDINEWIAPYRPDPPDGATDVPVNTLLSFIGASNEMYMRAGTPDDLVDYPICSFFQGEPCSNPFDPGPLEPYTTYYWRAGNWCVGCYHGEGAISDTWSFTTGAGPVPAEPSTWGRVKALYRE